MALTTCTIAALVLYTLNQWEENRKPHPHTTARFITCAAILIIAAGLAAAHHTPTCQ